jgi:alpha-glucuronidase
MRRLLPVLAVILSVGVFAASAQAETGHDLWLRYRPVEAQHRASYAVTQWVMPAASPMLAAGKSELQRGLSGVLGAEPPQAQAVSADGALVVGLAASPLLASLGLPAPGREGYVIRAATLNGHAVTVIAGGDEAGVLYGVFAYLRRIQARAPVTDIASAPRNQLRLLNHWDNLDGTVERGYAGASIWNWPSLPEHVPGLITDYARANASIGINGTVLNNVNAQAAILTPAYIEKAKAVADALRPWNIRVYLSVRWSAPIEIGGLKSADPLDPAVQRWWAERAADIYRAIPDFGGFLVKANSEGQPGPQDYQRSHADGANMIADVLKPHGGIVMWRAFVYADDPARDRMGAAYREFVPLDGQFRDNVVLQVKNGPLDFQPREPFSPLFAAMPKTPLMLELQITKEYLGQKTHLVYLGAQFSEVLQTDTFAHGPGSTIARIVDGSLDGHRLSGIAGVANIGNDANWSGSIFNQADWYAFGRLAWDPGLSPRAIAAEWAAQTFTADPAFVAPVTEMMMLSREAVVHYMTPLGLHHIMAHGHHMGPAPWDDIGPREDWKAVYYHRAAKDGIGWDRKASGFTAQYKSPLTERFADAATTPEDALLWFHRLAWDHRMPSGRTLWAEMVARYRQGVAEVAAMQAAWAKMRTHVDAERFAQVSDYLAIQHREAVWWRDACLAYFAQFSGQPFPKDYAPKYPLAVYQAMPAYASPPP